MARSKRKLSTHECIDLDDENQGLRVRSTNGGAHQFHYSIDEPTDIFHLVLSFNLYGSRPHRSTSSTRLVRRLSRGDRRVRKKKTNHQFHDRLCQFIRMIIMIIITWLSASNENGVLRMQASYLFSRRNKRPNPFENYMCKGTGSIFLPLLA